MVLLGNDRTLYLDTVETIIELEPINLRLPQVTPSLKTYSPVHVR